MPPPDLNWGASSEGGLGGAVGLLLQRGNRRRRSRRGGGGAAAAATIISNQATTTTPIVALSCSPFSLVKAVFGSISVSTRLINEGSRHIPSIVKPKISSELVVRG
jgi:hypothetical protein